MPVPWGTSVSTNQNNGQYVSPLVTYYSPDGQINIDYQGGTNVTVTGIVNHFNYELDLSSSAMLLNAFDVSGFVIDCRLQSHAPDFSQVSVKMANDAATKNAMKSAIAKALAGATDPGGVVMDQFLANVLRDAFSAVFPNLLGSSPVSGNGGSTGPNVNGSTGAEGADSQTFDGSSLPGTNAGANAIVNSVSVSTSTRINGFAVDVFTNTTTAAANLWDTHNGQDLKQLFLQIPRATYELYLPAGVSGEFEILATNALPMKLGDTVTFVFDIDVKTVGGNTSARGSAAKGDSQTLEGAIGNTGPDSENISYQDSSMTAETVGTDQFSLNLSNQRVAFNLTLSHPSAQVAAGATGYKGANNAFAMNSAVGAVSAANLVKGMLRLTSESAAAGANPGPGVGPAGSWPAGQTGGATGAVDDGMTGSTGYGDVQGQFGNQQPR
jgi:hypothetical protein